MWHQGSEPFCTVFFGKIQETCGIEEEREGPARGFRGKCLEFLPRSAGGSREFYGTGGSSWNDFGVGMATAF